MVDEPTKIGGYTYPIENPRRIPEIQKRPEQQKKDTSNGTASKKQSKKDKKPGDHVDTLA
jgi:hypothetical protein